MSQATLSAGTYHNSNLFSTYYLDERVQDLEAWDCDAEAQAAFDRLRDLYEDEQGVFDGYNEDNLLDSWIDEVLDVLGYETLQETPLPDTGGFVDRLLFDSADDRRDAIHLQQEGQLSAAYGRGLAVLEAKQWDADFSARFSEQRPYRNASHQIKHYLERMPESIQWGILTNGRKWRLYGTKDYETQTYYEVDLPELLERGDLEAFKRFYVFFRTEAVREVAGTTFLDTVWSESETAAKELGEDLQDNVFTALRVLGEGFLATNDELDIGPDDQEALDQLKEQSLVLLYRLMFVLYAEARDLIHPEGPGARQEYAENFSLEEVCKEVKDEIDSGEDFHTAYSEFRTGLWSRLEDLFGLIDRGNEQLGIPPYNGGLFDAEEHAFLAKYEVADRYLAEVVYRISTTESERNGGVVFADYADLDTRHLGSIYEGLLEHQFRVAGENLAAVGDATSQEWQPADEVSDAGAEAVETVDAGELYVVNDEGERKATGAYYTPDYVVTYIVEETVNPLLVEIREDLKGHGLRPGEEEYVYRFADEVLELKVLDPAMGSGHFLTKATGYLAEQVQEAAREAGISDVLKEEQTRRQVAKECIYGVDLNEMAVELAKLSMWLETLASDQPLAFLDHHLKTGNSLVGSDIEGIIEDGEDQNGEPGQVTLEYDFEQTRRDAMEHLMDVYQEFLAIEDDGLEDVQAMERKYREIERDELRQRLVAMANVRTAEDFGLDVPDGAYGEMARALDNNNEWASVEKEDWFRTAQVMADEKRFLHWKLEFPEVFYDIDGAKRENGGFDSIVGNPPYGDILSDVEKRYCRTTGMGFESERADVFTAFVALPEFISKPSGFIGYILPNTLLRGQQYETFRRVNSERYSVRAIADFGQTYVFDEEVFTTIIVLSNTDRGESYITDYVSSSEFQVRGDAVELEVNPGTDERWAPIDMLTARIQSDEQTTQLEPGLCTCHDAGIDYKVSGQGWQNRGEGIKISDLILYEGEKKNDADYRYIGGGEVEEYLIRPEDKWLRHDYESYVQGDIVIQVYPEYNEISEKIVTRQTADSIIGAIDRDQLYTAKSVHTTLLQDDQYDLEYVLAVLNSNVIDHIYRSISGEEGQTFAQVTIGELRNLPIPEIDFNKESQSQVEKEDEDLIAEDIEVDKILSESHARWKSHNILTELVKEIQRLKDSRASINTDLLDYLGNYANGSTLADLNPIPPDGVADSVLVETTETRDNLRFGEVTVERNGGDVTVHATARYKPDDEDTHETDRYGYTETALEPAMRLHGLDDRQVALVEAFVPVAAAEAGGFAGFRENATKTNSLLDRLEALTLPRLADVAGGLERYREARTRATELDEQIERTDDLINEIVYRLYGLTDEEVAIVEEALEG